MNKLAFALAVRDITQRVNQAEQAAGRSVKKLSSMPAAAKDIVNMDSLSGGLADSLGPATLGGDRAGRSQAMAAAAGRNPSFGVKHPAIQSLGYTTAGGVLGGVAGNVVGGALGAATASKPDQGNAMYAGAVGGGAVGSVAGMFLGLLASAAARRKDMRATNEAYDAKRSRGQLDPKAPELSAISAALLPFRGPHRRGQMQGYYMASGEDEKPLNTSTQLKYIAEHLPYIGLPVSVVGGYGQNIATQLESRAARSQKTSHVVSSGKQVKTAIDIVRRVRRRQGGSPRQGASRHQRVGSFSQLPAAFQQRFRLRNSSGLNVGYNDQAAVEAFNRLYAGTTKQLAAPGGAGQKSYASEAIRQQAGLRGTPGTATAAPTAPAAATPAPATPVAEPPRIWI